MGDFELIRKGEEDGNGILFRLKTSKGTEIYGLPTPNNYGGDWDLGPTWNYLIASKELTLVDTGRWGEGKRLMEMIEDVGHDPGHLCRVVISHGHEDHDGGLTDIIAETQATLAVHEIYERLIPYYRDRDLPPGAKSHFPASCWHCPMPESFSSVHCTRYQRERSVLKVDVLIHDGNSLDEGALQFYHIPGHAPDSLAILVDREVLLCGDTILPQITPHPSQEAFYFPIRTILPDDYTKENTIFGLRAYIKSIKRLAELDVNGFTTLPAHRLYYRDRWNWINLKERANEILDHHIERCGHVLSMISEGSNTVDEIVKGHFEPSKLKGLGMIMARNEIHSHLELLEVSGDVRWVDREHLECNGTVRFESCIHSL